MMENPEETCGSSTEALKCYTAPGVVFESRAALHAHYKTEWHRYNLKRKVANMPPIPKNMFDKLQLIAKEREAALNQSEKKQDHLKKDKKRSASIDQQTKTSASESDSINYEIDEEELKKKVDVTVCFMDDRKFSDITKNLEYMHKKFGFFVPDSEYVIDLEGIVKYCTQKVKAGRLCLYCDRPFSTGKAAIQHMIAKSHCKIPWETEDHVEEYEDYYDFSALEDKESPVSVELLDSGALLLTNRDTKKTKLVAHREFAQVYKQNVRSDDTRAAVLATTKERVLLLYKKAGVDTGSQLASLSFNGKRPDWLNPRVVREQKAAIRYANRIRLRDGMQRNLLTKNRQHQKKQMGAGFGVHG